jgi:27-O-demethylrifamycin SV methyltransferase
MIEDNGDPAAHYDRVTEAWRLLLGQDLHYGVFVTGNEPLSEATAVLTNRMVEAAQLQPGLRVLDVGCGNGVPGCFLAGNFGVNVVGITTSKVGVSLANECAAAAGLTDKASFELRDGTDNGYPDKSFDRAWVLESSHLMRERDKLISECARVLKPEGRMVLCDIIRKREIPFPELRERRHEFQILRGAFGDAHMQPLELYVELAERSGLNVDHTEDLTAATIPTFDRWRSNAKTHKDLVLDALGAEGFSQFVRSTDILEAFWNDGTFGYALISAGKAG